MDTLRIRYALTLAPDRVEVFDIHLDPQSLEIRERDTGPLPDWTALGFQQCPNCPLDAETHPTCPLAASIVDIVNRFGDVVSYDEVDVEVVTPQRTIHTRTPSQAALRSLMGLLIACSGCPRTAFFKPMARFHLPFADQDETMARAVGAWLTVQYFRNADGRSATLDLAGLDRIYEHMRTVNKATAERLRAATRTDASVNAVALLDMYALLVPYLVESTLHEMRGPYETILAQLDEAP